ncbi:MAG: ATP-dependent RecD-like DNA helicase [Clostridia bacterium]|nr:ATP-dependent RecD-like DNA helicase [Clostridia bacterium]
MEDRTGDGTVIRGYVGDIIFHNSENGYSVFTICCEGTDVTATGSVHGIRPGEYIEISGSWTDHKRYGKQFTGMGFNRSMPGDDNEAMVRYLSSGFVKGIGAATAQRIVDKFGRDTARILEETPERLAEVRGISLEKAMLAGNAVNSRKALARTILYFTKFGLSPEKGAKACLQLGDDAVEKIIDNPYILISGQIGLTFKQADAIAAYENRGTDEFLECQARVYSGIGYVLEKAMESGHTYLPMDLLIESCRRVLGIRTETIEDEIARMLEDGLLKSAGSRIYLSRLYDAEKYTAERLKQLSSFKYAFSENMEYALNESLMELHVTLDETQAKACMEAAGNGVSVISGGPGTGKTTIIKALIGMFEKTGKSCSLAAPTGRAAKRMQQSSGREARTIHRLLEIDFIGAEDMMQFARNENNPLEADAVIIDEMSMVDIELMHALLKAVKAGTRLVLIGDVDQLPAVGPGTVLQDIIESGRVHCTILQNIYRQETGSSIPLVARDINEGRLPDFNPPDGSFVFLETRGSGRVMELMTKIIKSEMENTTDIQVITPGKKGPAGTISLNRMMQDVFNPGKPGKSEKKYISRIFREGDKVMQIKNNYEIEYTAYSGIGKGVYNGDIGILAEVDAQSEMLRVVYDGEKTVIYDFKDADQLETAYAITVHKSQGSEYGTVVMPLFGVNDMLCTRNLLYTAVSRAVRKLYVIGSREIFSSMISNEHRKPRYSGLKGLLID